ncbi:MAG TPA: hypothetical protein VEW28_08815 [Candidatus Kapabacteria bacterium]|nr:hypothetical protein [Candidatus Kapabacteria bacterium]
MKIRILVTVLLLSTVFANLHAQFWHVLPPLEEDNSVGTTFSNDDKRIYYLATDSLGKKNIFAIDIKTQTVMQITKFTDAPVVRFFHLPNKPSLVYMKATADHPTDYHIYRTDNNAKDQPEDLTPTKPGVQNIILGEQYNGRYVYYSTNKRNPSKLDYYRYDAAQNISELVFTNDKAHTLVAWSRDESKVLMLDPSMSKLFLSDVQTTERFPLYTPAAGKKILTAMWTPDNKQLFVLESGGSYAESRAFELTSPTSISSNSKLLDSGAITYINASINGRCFMEMKNDILGVNDYKTESVTILQHITDAVTNAKETYLLECYTLTGALKFRIYDLTKKSSFEPIVVKMH